MDTDMTTPTHPTPPTARLCGHCHTCGGPLRHVLDGEEWCDECGAYRRYQSHGWSAGTFDANSGSCPIPATTPSTAPTALLRAGSEHLVYFIGIDGRECVQAVTETEWRGLLDANEGRVTYSERGYYSFSTEVDGRPLFVAG